MNAETDAVAMRSSTRRATLVSMVCAACVSGCGMPASDHVAVNGHTGDCVLCHLQEWSNTRSPRHAEAMLNQLCADCHTTTAWTPADGYQHTATFPLTFGHSGVACVSCHIQSFDRDRTPHDCASCHAAAAAGVADPIHAGLTNDCFACHRTDAFWPAHFVHSWPLQGKHMLTSCRSCHMPDGTGQAAYEQTPSACLNCHAAERQRANGAVTGHAEFPDTCDNCHGFKSFAEVTTP